jgi:3-oxoadipate enol-lactonase
VIELNAVAEGEGDPTVLLHPIGLDTTCWDAVAERLRRRRRVIRLDLRGHGASPREPLAADLREFTGDVALTLRKLGVSRAPVVGVSFGGMVATALAIDHPDLVSVLIPSACPSAVADSARDMMRARGTAALENGMASVVDETLKRWFTDGFRASPEVERYRRRLLTDDAASWAAGWNAIAEMNLTARLKDIAVPTLCIHAENDLATPLAAMQATAAGIRDARLAVIEGAPHMVHVEMPDAFAEKVEGFLGPR